MGNLNIALVALVVTSVSVAVTASALNAIAISQSETEPQRYNLTHESVAKLRGSAAPYDVVHITMPKAKSALPPELVPVD